MSSTEPFPSVPDDGNNQSHSAPDTSSPGVEPAPAVPSAGAEAETANDSDNQTGFALDWTTEMERLRSRYPTATDGILFCIYKLQGNPELSLRDFRDEASLHGISLSGRSVHSARVLLGWEQPSTRRTKAKTEKATPRSSRASIAMGSERPRSSARPGSRAGRRGGSSATTIDFSSLEEQLRGTFQDMQSKATEESARLRQGIAQAIEVLQAALDGD